MNFAQNLRKLMDENSLSNYQLAKDLDVHPSTVAYWLDGTAPRKKTLAKIADYFRVSVDYLTGKEKAPSDDGERKSDTEIAKIALFGGDTEVTDEMWEEAMLSAEIIKEKYKRKKKG